jgi:hypothetical protein
VTGRPIARTTYEPEKEPPMTRTARRAAPTRCAALALAAGLAALALTSCSPERLGAAAVIDGQTVSTDELQAAARDYVDVVPGADPAEVQVAVLQRRIVSEIIDRAASEAGVAVRAGTVAAERDDLLDSIGGRKALVRALASSQQPTILAPSDVDQWVRDRLLFDALAAEISGEQLDPADPAAQEALNEANRQLSRTSRSMEIEVSPRYGEWDPRSGLTPLVSGGLSQTVAELRGS